MAKHRWIRAPAGENIENIAKDADGGWVASPAACDVPHADGHPFELSPGGRPLVAERDLSRDERDLRGGGIPPGKPRKVCHDPVDNAPGAFEAHVVEHGAQVSPKPPGGTGRKNPSLSWSAAEPCRVVPGTSRVHTVAGCAAQWRIPAIGAPGGGLVEPQEQEAVPGRARLPHELPGMRRHDDGAVLQEYPPVEVFPGQGHDLGAHPRVSHRVHGGGRGLPRLLQQETPVAVVLPPQPMSRCPPRAVRVGAGEDACRDGNRVPTTVSSTPVRLRGQRLADGKQVEGKEKLCPLPLLPRRAREQRWDRVRRQKARCGGPANPVRVSPAAGVMSEPRIPP